MTWSYSRPLIARLGGEIEADRVTTSTLPTQVVRSVVSNAQTHAVRLEPQVVAADPELPIARAADVLSAWAPTDEVRSPTLMSIRTDLWHALDESFPPPAPLAVAVGATVHEDVTLENGEAAAYSVSLAPNETSALRIDVATGEPGAVGAVDRSGHFTAEVANCPYCHDYVCEACDDGPTECRICGIGLCARCSHDGANTLRRCPGCSNLRRATRPEARAHGRKISARGLLISTDDVHTAVFERQKASWHRVDSDGPPIDDDRVQLLNQCYDGPK